MGNTVGQFLSGGGEASPLPFHQVFALLSQSVLVGAVLVFVTYAAGRVMAPPATGSLDSEALDQERVQQLTGAASLLLLCVGLTGVMLIINDNIVRAFALLAAISVVRFRVRLDRKHISTSVLNVSLLFAVLGGVACGLGETQLAWTITGFYAVVLGLVTLFISLVRR